MIRPAHSLYYMYIIYGIYCIVGRRDVVVLYSAAEMYGGHGDGIDSKEGSLQTQIVLIHFQLSHTHTHISSVCHDCVVFSDLSKGCPVCNPSQPYTP